MSIVISNIELDGEISGENQILKGSVRVASINNIDMGTFNIDVDRIDNVLINIGDKVLLKDQTNKIENGLYDINQNKNFERCFGYGDNERVGSTMVWVKEGDINLDSGWICINNTNEDIVGQHDLFYKKIGGNVSSYSYTENIIPIFDSNGDIKNSTINPPTDGGILTYKNNTYEWINKNYYEIINIIDDYTLTYDDDILLIDVSIKSISLILPKITQKKIFSIVDINGNSETNNIIINTNIDDTFFNEKSFIIDSNFGSINLVNDGISKWFISK